MDLRLAHAFAVHSKILYTRIAYTWMQRTNKTCSFIENNGQLLQLVVCFWKHNKWWKANLMWEKKGELFFSVNLITLKNFSDTHSTAFSRWILIGQLVNGLISVCLENFRTMKIPFKFEDCPIIMSILFCSFWFRSKETMDNAHLRTMNQQISSRS